MSIAGLIGIRKEMFPCYETMMKRCKWKGKTYEGVPIEPSWTDFDTFVKDNWFRYCRAKIKWQNYIRLAPRKNMTGKLKLKPVWFIRYDKPTGYTKENTVFTNPSDGTKNASSTHKYMFEERLLGTRDIKRILKKRGIDIEMEAITKRLRKRLPIISNSIKQPIFYKNKWCNYADVARMENISYDLLKKRCIKDGESLKEAILYCKNYRDNILPSKQANKVIKELSKNLSTLRKTIKEHENI